MMFKKYFTPQEANRRLPLVKGIVADIIQKGKRARMIMASTQGDEPPAEIEILQEEIEELMGELEVLGCFYKDWNFEIGLVDFPAVINGEEVLLCWRSDEPFVRWYHGLEDGFPGRKLIPENLLEA
jgi:hypothetical protein